MKQGQFSQEQIVAILQQAEKGEITIEALCCDKGITQTTFYRWRRIYGGMNVSEAQRLKELEKENARLKRLLAAFCVVDVRAGAHPLHDLAVLVAHRQRASEMPAVGAVRAALETVLHLVVFARGE